MKILVIQLARLGDIYMTWPALRALKRSHPNAEIHFLCRHRFKGATEGLDVVDRYWEFNTKDFVEPFLHPGGNFEMDSHFEQSTSEAVSRLDNFLTGLKNCAFNWVINYSFSPVSSFLVHSIAMPSSRITGYSRDMNGDLSIADPISEYFYAQVGVEKFNRIHLADIFVGMLHTEYIPEDWRGSDKASTINLDETPKLTIHLGASSKEKCVPGFIWARVIRLFQQKLPNYQVVLIGSDEDRLIANEVIAQVDTSRILDFVGKTKINDLFAIISSSKLLAGCDSSPIHIAALTDTPVYNLSVGNVNFWETGPKSSYAFVDKVNQVSDLNSNTIAELLVQILEGHPPSRLISRYQGIESYQAPQTPAQAFAWDFIKALYFGEAFPICDDLEFYEAMKKVYATIDVVWNGLRDLPEHSMKSLAHIVDTSDEILHKIAEMVPKVRPLVWWLEAQKIRIPPGSKKEVLEENKKIYQMLVQVVKMYIPREELNGGTNG